MRRQMIIHLLVASFLIFASVFMKVYLSKSTDELSNALSMVENRLHQIKNEEKKIDDFVIYKKRVGDVRKAIRVEPVEFDAHFSSDEIKNKIDEIVNSTYLEKGFFFLDSFRIAESNNDEEENSRGELKLSLKGKKVLVFGFEQ